MKKLIVLFAILAMVNVASAGMVDIVISSLNGQPITPTHEITILGPVPASTWIDVDVVYSGAQGWSAFALSKEMVITGPMTASIGIGVSKPATPGTLTWLDPTWDNDYSQVTMLPNGNPLIDIAAKTLGLPTSGTILDHFLFHCEGIGNVTIALVENSNTGAMESLELDPALNSYHLDAGAGIVIHQIPEPMTLVLLGLGSLFLARRKK